MLEKDWDYRMIQKLGEYSRELLSDIFEDDNKVALFYEKNCLTLYPKDKYEAVVIVFAPKGQMLQHYYHSKEAVLENDVRTLNVWKRHLDPAIARERLVNEIQALLDMRYSVRKSQKRLF